MNTVGAPICTVDTSAPQQAQPAVTYVDTETLGLNGLPFLLQFSRPGGKAVEIVHVFDTSPAEVVRIVNDLVAGATIVGHNVAFDVTMLSKLLTVASTVSDWSFESIWAAESFWRGDVPYEERLKVLWLIYPAAVEDTLIAAQSLPPLHETFMRPVTARFGRLPVPMIPQIQKTLAHALIRQPFYSGGPAGLRVGDAVKTYVDGATNKKERQRLAAAIAREDFDDQRDVRFTVKVRDAYSLKSVAKLLGFEGEIHRFDFMDDVGRVRPECCPTYRDKRVYKAIYDYAVAQQYDSRFLDYARRDVEMLEFVHRHYTAQPGYECLRQDFAVIPLMANLRLYGVHVDPARVAATQQLFNQRLEESRKHLEQAGLDNFNSSTKVVRFVNRILRAHLSATSISAMGSVDDMQDETLDRVLDAMARQLPDKHGALESMRHLVRARRSAKRLQFFDSVVGDTLYPTFQVKGTQTNRMTSTRPAIQTIPKADADEKDIAGDFRHAFTPPPGYTMMVGDFDQFEMRLMAAMTQEEHLLKAFTDRIDTHSVTALRTMESQVRAADKRYAEISKEALLHALAAKEDALKSFRARGKVLNFAIGYGATEWGISRLANIDVREAQGLIESFHQAYPALSSAIRETHGQVSALVESAGVCRYPTVHSQPAPTTEIKNAAGPTRSFELPLRIVQILMRMAEAEDVSAYLPILKAWNAPSARYYDGERTREQIVRSQLRSAARKLQSFVHREAFNFKIQSLGAYYTKDLQVELARAGIQPGIHRASDLSVLPGINVHDEIHLYVRNREEVVVLCAEEYARRISSDVGAPIEFDLLAVNSWAEKS